MMPVAKTIAGANEVYYAEHDEYATAPTQLNVTPQAGTPDGVTLEMISDEKNSYVLAYNETGVPNNNYVVYQKLSENFPGNIHCEALTGDSKAEELCTNLGGSYIGENGRYTAYLLSGDSTTGTFDKECKGAQESTETDCACGTSTREVSCDTKTGEWTYGNWSQCPPKPDTSQECSKNGKTGTQTLSVTCVDGTWTSGNWGTCDIPCEGNQPANITASNSGATGTAQCVEGEWVYSWTGGATFSVTNCTVGKSYDCAGGIFKNSKYCGPNSAYSTFEYGCAGGIFEGSYSSCSSRDGPYTCANSVFSGKGSYCAAKDVTSCSGSTFYPGAYCLAAAAGGCENVTYQTGEDANGNPTSGCCFTQEGHCPIGSPKCTISGWSGSNMEVRWSGKCWGEGGTEVDCE